MLRSACKTGGDNKEEAEHDYLLHDEAFIDQLLFFKLVGSKLLYHIIYDHFYSHFELDAETRF